jgi:hypothetical protein
MTRGIILLTRMASPTVEHIHHSPPERRTIHHWSGSVTRSSDSITTLTEYQGNYHEEESLDPNETTQRITIVLRTMKDFLFHNMDKHHPTTMSKPQKQQQLRGTSNPPPLSPLGMVIQAVVVQGVHAKCPQHLMCWSEQDDDEYDMYGPQQVHPMEGEDPALDAYHDAVFMDAFSKEFSKEYSSGDSSVTMRYEDFEDRPDDLILQALLATGHYDDQEVATTTPQGMIIHVPSIIHLHSVLR